MLVDVHAHMDWKDFQDDLDEIIQRARDNKVVSIISNGVNPESNRMTVALAKKYSLIKPALGLYPTDAVKLTDRQVEKEIEFIKKSKPVAIGEIGLDLKHLKSLDGQREVFIRMLELAAKLKAPAIVHTRKAEKDVLDTIETTKAKKIILHTFMGKLHLAKRAEGNGYYFSVPPMIDYNKQLQDLAKQISISQLLTETDSPFLSHERGKRNEPCNVRVVLDNFAKIKKLDRDEVEKMVYMNYVKLF